MATGVTAAALTVYSLLFVSGGAKFAWFAMLKKSARTCRQVASPKKCSGKLLDTETSVLISPGPVSWLRPSLPSSVDGFGIAKALRLDVVRGIAGIHWLVASIVGQTIR